MPEDENVDGIEEVYSDTGRVELVEDDEITPEEEAFMQGYEQETEEKPKTDVDEIYASAFEGASSKKKRSVAYKKPAKKKPKPKPKKKAKTKAKKKAVKKKPAKKSKPKKAVKKGKKKK